MVEGDVAMAKGRACIVPATGGVVEGPGWPGAPDGYVNVIPPGILNPGLTAGGGVPIPGTGKGIP